jgi:hypothetical protein
MKLSIIKEIENGETEKLVFNSEIAELSCDNAKQIAFDTDAVFDLVLSKTGDTQFSKPREFFLQTLVDLLIPDKETKEMLQSCYNASNMIDKNKVSVAQLSVSCNSGRVKLSINAPEIDSGITLVSNKSRLKIGLGFTFHGGIRFNAGDIQCDELKFVK